MKLTNYEQKVNLGKELVVIFWERLTTDTSFHPLISDSVFYLLRQIRIHATDVTGFCPCLKSLPEIKVKRFGLILLIDEISEQCSIDSVMYLLMCMFIKIYNKMEPSQSRINTKCIIGGEKNHQEVKWN